MGYSKQIHEKAWATLDERRLRSREEYILRRQEIISAIPQIERLEREMASLAAKSIHAAASGGGGVAERVREFGRENLRLQEIRASLLREAGYPEDALSEQFVCPKCRDKGYVDTKMCDCLGGLLRTQAYATISDLPDSRRSKSHTFEGFDLSYYQREPENGTAHNASVSPRQRMTEVFDYCRHYAHTFCALSPSLLMRGRTGLGKTHLSLSIAATVVERGFGVVYTPVQRLCDRLASANFSYKDESKQRYEMEQQSVLDCDLLVLDDLGTEFDSSFSRAAVGNIIDSRLLDNRPTIVSTNLEPKALEQQYGQRMASRLNFSYKALAFMGEDIRYLMRTGNR